MIPLLGRQAVRALDARAIERGVPSLVLMENAGRGAADVIEREVLGGRASGRRVVVLAGTGNNGGDGFVVARHLRVRGARVDVMLAGDPAKLTPDARAMRDAWIAIGGAVDALAPGGALRARLEEDGGPDALVDALFGTGLSRAVAGPAAEAIRAAHVVPRSRRVALDIPSGLDADSGAAMGETFVAAVTVTFAHRKVGLYTPGGAAHAGAIHVVDIGIPGALPAGVTPAALLLEWSDVARALAPRVVGGHKGSAGHVAVLAGSPGKTGAALLAAHGAFRAGAGVVTIATRAEAARDLDRRVLEAMTLSLDPQDPSAVERALEGKRAAVAGPGFGTDDVALAFLRRALEVFDGRPMVLDADALTCFARGHATEGALANARARLVLTPHPGEAARLLRSSAPAVEADRLTAARTLAARAQAVVVLKGAHTVIAEPSGRVVVSPFAVPALATAGAGDVLAGMMAAILCTVDDAFDAASAAVYLHALAAERWSALHGDRGLLAHEVADGVPALLAEVLRGRAAG